MKKTLLGGIGLILIMIVWKNYIPKSSIIGKYVNNNTESILEGPSHIHNGVDTLRLFDNGTFKSRTWGDGTYVFDDTFFESKIELTYSEPMGNAGYQMIVIKSLLGNIKLLLNLDLNFYFEKVE
ncbi:MAG: hypothetical protein ACPGTP_03515 [Bacteroidia bacterium]